MTPDDQLSVLAFIVLGLFAFHPQLNALISRRRGVAPPARLPRWDPAIAREAQDLAKEIEETRLMPGAEQRDPGDENDQVAEGVGMVRPPHCERAYPSHTTPLELLPIGERQLWREAIKAGL